MTAGLVKTNKPGVYTKEVKDRGGIRDVIYYIIYRTKDGKQHEEPVGKRSEGCNVQIAYLQRALRKSGKALTNRDAREQESQKNRNEAAKSVLGLWELYDSENSERRSRKTDISNVKHFGKKMLNADPEGLTTRDITLWRKALEKIPSIRRAGEKISPQTVQHIMELLRRVMDYAHKQGLISYPEKLVFDFPEVDNEKTERLTAEEYAKIWDTLSSDPDQLGAAYVKLIMLTGIRADAAISLRWDDIDFEGKTILLRGENAKSGKTKRIPVFKTALEILRTIPRTDSEWVFPSTRGSKTGHRDNFDAVIRRMKAAGLPEGFRPLHGMRHVFATWLASSGKVSYPELQQFLTHSTPAMTQRYLSFFPEDLQKKLDEAMESLPLPVNRQE